MAAFEEEWLLMQQGYATRGPWARLRRLAARRRGSAPRARPGAAVRIDPAES